jgi:hypothetical protein
VKYICQTLLQDETVFDVGFYKTEMQFLAFSDFLPLQSEGMALIMCVIWHKVILKI